MLSESILRSSAITRCANRALLRNKSLPVRRLRLHEYQASKFLKQNGVQTPHGNPAFTSKEAYLVATQFGKQTKEYVVKAQILAGGRGLGVFKENGFKGGVHIVKSTKEVEELASKMCGNTLVTKQTGEDGIKCNCVYIVEKIEIEKEFYLSITLDRAAGMPVIIYSKEGGMAIEDVAHATPEKIHKIHINVDTGMDLDSLIQAATNLGAEKNKSDLVFMLKSMYDTFMKHDCDLIEINPLVITKDGRLLAADAKCTIDDNARFRQKELSQQEDVTQQNYKERLAHEYDLNYIHIGGNIGCLVNGAGLAMSTMDILSLHKGHPANFLDVGGSASDEQMLEAIKLLNDDPEVKSIFINIFGGILKCDNLASSIIKAAKEVNLDKPIVLRLKGTNSDKAKLLIKDREKELGIFYNEDFDSAARLAVEKASL